MSGAGSGPPLGRPTFDSSQWPPLGHACPWAGLAGRTPCQWSPTNRGPPSSVFRVGDGSLITQALNNDDDHLSDNLNDALGMLTSELARADARTVDKRPC